MRQDIDKIVIIITIASNIGSMPVSTEDSNLNRKYYINSDIFLLHIIQRTKYKDRKITKFISRLGKINKFLIKFKF